MDIKKMLEAQKELDKANMEKGGLTEYPLEMVQTAYRVELGELLQEWKQFKFWKLNKGEIDREKMLEEWADCMHFALSLELFVVERLEVNFTNKHYTKSLNLKIRYLDKNDIYGTLDSCYEINSTILNDTIILGLKLGYTLEELEKAYWRKNKINWERIEGGY